MTLSFNYEDRSPLGLMMRVRVSRGSPIALFRHELATGIMKRGNVPASEGFKSPGTQIYGAVRLIKTTRQAGNGGLIRPPHHH